MNCINWTRTLHSTPQKVRLHPQSFSINHGDGDGSENVTFKMN